MLKSGYRLGCATLAVVAALVTTDRAAAQESATVEAPQAAGDIIVTATRRAQALSDVPLAVSAISGEQLLNSGVTDVRALNQLAPSLLVSGATSEVNFSARIRGIGTVGENPGIESSVALFIDGVYRSRTGVGLTDLGEIDRVEVLRGPQGTLFGRNASAGIISITTVQPQFETEFSGAATYGNYDNIRLEGMANVALSDTVAFRVEGLWHQRDGFIYDQRSDRRFNDRNRWMLRGQLRFEPSDDVSIRLIADYNSRDEQCCAASFLPARSLVRGADGSVNIIPNTLDPVLRALGATSPRGELFTVAVSPNRDYASEGEDWGFSGEVNWDLGGANLTSITAYRDFYNRQGQDSDFTDLDIFGRDNLQRRFRTFTQELRLQGTLFDDRLDWLIGGFYSDEKLRVSDNIRFGADSERYFDCVFAAAFGSVNPAVPRCTNLPAAVLPGHAAMAQILGAARLPGTGVGDGGFFRHNSRNFAFFTHNVFDIIEDTLFLTVGARYTNERKTIEGVFNNNNTLCTALRTSTTPVSVAAPNTTFTPLACAINATAGPGFASGAPGTRLSESQWTGTVSLGWKPGADWLVYGGWSRGYKAGGFNLDTSAVDIVCSTAVGTPAQRTECARQQALPANTVGNARPEAVDLQFGAETVDAYEFGVKFAQPGFSANLALFRQYFSNFQLNTFNGVNFEVTNVQACRDDLGGADSDGSALTGGCASDRLKPGVISEGVELEVFASPLPDISATAGLTYTDTRFRRDLVGTGGRPLSPVLFQLPGRLISNASPLTLTGSLSWNPEVSTSGLRALFYIDYRLQDAFNTGSDLDLEKVEQSVFVMNGRIGLIGAERRWSIELWGQNLLNKQYFQIGADAPLQGTGTFRAVRQGIATSANALFLSFPGEPRTFGVTGRFRF